MSQHTDRVDQHVRDLLDDDGDGDDQDTGQDVIVDVVQQHRQRYASNVETAALAIGGNVNRLQALSAYVRNGGYSEPMSTAEFDAQQNAREFLAWSTAAALVLFLSFLNLYVNGAMGEILFGAIGTLLAVLGVGSALTWYALRD